MKKYVKRIKMKYVLLRWINRGNFLLLITIFLSINCDRINLPPYQAIVFAGYSGQSGALVDGIPTFASIEEALQIVPSNNETAFVIYIRNGRYHEKLSVDKSHIHFMGESRDETIISYDATGDTPGPDGKPYGTWGCSTLQINATNFHAENLTIENGFDYPANAAKAVNDPTKVRHPQAVAVMTACGSDQTVFRNCKIVGYQDTFFANALNSWSSSSCSGIAIPQYRSRKYC